MNEQPFFPILLYDAPTDDETLRELHSFGFNVLSCDAKTSAPLPAKGFYGGVHHPGAKADLSGVLFAVGVDSPALNFKKNLMPRLAEANAKTRAAAPGRPLMNAIGYWEDEPAGVINGKLPSKSTYEDVVAAIDVAAPYLYPVPYQPVASVGEAVARARAATGGDKPLLPILQLFAWKADDRYPTPVELRCMAFLALVEGGHGIGYYSYSSVTGRPKTTIAHTQPELWRSVRRLNHDLADVGPRLLAAAKSPAIRLDDDPPAVKLKVVDDRRGLLAVLVNSSAKRQNVTLRVQIASPPRSLLRNGDESIELHNDTARLSLEPFAVEILRGK